jgi:hypothetical protein
MNVNAKKQLAITILSVIILVLPQTISRAAVVQESAAVAQVSWDLNPDPNVIGYKVHYGTESRTYRNTINTGLANTIEIGDLTPGQTYYFAVTDCYVSEETDYSDEVSIAIPADTIDTNTSNDSSPLPYDASTTNDSSTLPYDASTTNDNNATSSPQIINNDTDRGGNGSCFISAVYY